MMGGGGGMQRQQQEIQWPEDISSKVDKEHEWLINTEWQGKSGSYLFLRGGEIKS